MRRLISGTGLRSELVRFLLAGGGVAALTVLIYWLAAGPLGWPPLLANLLSYIFNLAAGFRIHGTWSFRRDRARAERAAGVRYVLVSLSAFGLNSLWVWLLTGVGRAPAWTPVLPMLFVTPLFTFAAARRWIFGRAPAAG